MPQAQVQQPVAGEDADVGSEIVARAAAALAEPGLVVVHGGPGCGRSGLLRRLGESFRGPVLAGGGLASLRTVPAFALAAAVRVRLPEHDAALLVEAVRARVRGGLLLLDDVQWADPLTVAVLPALAGHCRVAVAVRTPHRLPGDVVAALRRAARLWLTVPPLSEAAAAVLARRVAPTLPEADIGQVVRRAGGSPLVVDMLARHAAAGGRPASDPGAVGGDGDAQVRYAIAEALADLNRPARTALAALGLLGRPAPAAVLGAAGAAQLTEANLVRETGDGSGLLAAVSPYIAQVAAGLLPVDTRRRLHRHLAAVTAGVEAVRHLAAAGDHEAAYRQALAAADAAGDGGQRAEALALACTLPGVRVDPAVRLAAAGAALRVGVPQAALRLLADGDAGAGDAQAAAVRGEALLHLGRLAEAAAAVAAVPQDAAAAVVAGRDRIRLLTLLAVDPRAASHAAAAVRAAWGAEPPHPGLRAALAAVAAANREPGWEYASAEAVSRAAAAGEHLVARATAWLLVQTLAADGRLAEAVETAHAAAAACAADGAYSWQTRFVAAALFHAALRADPGAGPDTLLRQAADLADRATPADAHGYAVAAAALLEADGGLLGAARTRLGEAGASPAVEWVRREAAWLDGQPEVAATGQVPPGQDALLTGLHHITRRWALLEHPSPRRVPPEPAGTAVGRLPVAAAATLAAFDAAGDPSAFSRAAGHWADVASREHVRCLLAHGLRESEAARAVPPLLAAEELARRCGLLVLLGRTHRALRRHAVRRDQRGPRTAGALSARERDVLRLVAAGEPTRRIAGQLGVSAETVETHIRSGMRKLGARTRTEAAALVVTGASR